MIVGLKNNKVIKNVFICDFWIDEGTAYISICYRNEADNRLLRHETEVFNITYILE